MKELVDVMQPEAETRCYCSLSHPLRGIAQMFGKVDTDG